MHSLPNKDGLILAYNAECPIMPNGAIDPPLESSQNPSMVFSIRLYFQPQNGKFTQNLFIFVNSSFPIMPNEFLKAPR